MRIMGQVMGAFTTTATRRSVIFSPDGLELVLTFLTACPGPSSARKAPPIAAAELFKTLRRSIRAPLRLMFLIRSVSLFHLHALLRSLLLQPLVEFLDHGLRPLFVDLTRRVFSFAQHLVSPLIHQVRHLRARHNLFRELGRKIGR